MKKTALLITLLVSASLLLSIAGAVSAENLQPFTNLSGFFSLPPALKDTWSPYPLPVAPRDGRSAFAFTRKPIIDAAGVRVSPKVSFIFEPVDLPANLDAVQKANVVIGYSANLRMKYTIPTTIDKVYSSGDNLFPWKDAIGYKARYRDNYGMEHTLYLLHGLLEEGGRAYGVQVIMDCTTSVLTEVEPEFTAMLAQIGVGR